MKAVILAGGLGTRLRPVTYEIPKPLLPVKKKPIINHLIGLFLRHGVSAIAILASQEHALDFERWKKTWQDELPGEKISIFFEGKPRGTFGGFENLKDWLVEERFLMVNGDDLMNVDLKRLIDFHDKYRPVGTIALVKVPNPQEYGVVVLDGHRIKEFLEKPEKPSMDLISSGLYILEPTVFNYADFSKEVLMIEKDIFPKLAAQGQLLGLHMENSRWYDCGTLERWETAIKEWEIP